MNVLLVSFLHNYSCMSLFNNELILVMPFRFIINCVIFTRKLIHFLYLRSKVARLSILQLYCKQKCLQVNFTT